MTETAFFGYLAAGVAVVSIVTSAYFYICTLRLQKQIAVSQGAFRRSQVSIGVFGKLDNEHYLVAVPLARAKAVILPFNCIVQNTGDATAQDLELFVKNEQRAPLWRSCGNKSATELQERNVWNRE